MAFDGHAGSPEGVAGALFERLRSKLEAPAPTPLCTYRVQLNHTFTFDHARAIVPYLAKLGVTHLYTSPILRAAPGSLHGYDVIDHGGLNPEIGTPEQFDALCAELRAHGMGLLLDIVPNHMGIEKGQNPLWNDLLENGRASVYARYFDVDWEPVKDELRSKVLLPILGDQYGVVLESGELKLAFTEGAFRVVYFDHWLPVAPRQYATVLRTGLGELEAAAGQDDPELIELLSILTAVDHLPASNEQARPALVERNREKEVIKRRLAQLCAKSPRILAHVEGCVARINGTPGDPRSFDLLDRVLAGCHYRLAHWRVAGEEINYRRFFDINGLAAVRVEDPEVFAESHRLFFQWIAEGKLQGLRIDHPDGLFDPTAYFLQLQEEHLLIRARALHGGDAEAFAAVEPHLRERFRQAFAEDPSAPLFRSLYVVVEKIQGGRERIPDAWAVHGTTGYRFANSLTGLFVPRESERALTLVYERFTGVTASVHELTYEKKKLVMAGAMASEINVLARELNRISEMNRRTRDFTLNALRRALVEFIALFPVYRTYVDGWRPQLDGRDVQYIRWTLARARERDPSTAFPVFDFLEDILLRRYPPHLDERERAVMLRFAMKLQQLTGPVMAKGLEDTVFYVYNRLVALNEVGGEPERFGTPAETFHLRNQERSEKWPAAILTSSTHDTKRSEDVRARISVLAELPLEWRDALRRLGRAHRRYKTRLGELWAPAANDEYLFYQVLLGAWPMGQAPLGEADLASLRERLVAYMQKAAREAKVHTSWVNPNAEYEAALTRFVERVLGQDNPELSGSLRELKLRLEHPGQLNSISGLLLKLVSPGTCDIYQGNELWDLSLVDPDNRRPVDYALRAAMLQALSERARGELPALCRELLAHPDDGRLKLFVHLQALELRRRHPDLFRHGGYLPLDVEGPRARHALGLCRTHGQAKVVAVVPRFVATLLAQPGGMAGALDGTRVRLPDAFEGGVLRDVFTGARHTVARGPLGVGLDAAELLRHFPLGLLESEIP